VETNRHNNITTVYYLLLKKHLRHGGTSIADLTKYNPNNQENYIQKRNNSLNARHSNMSHQPTNTESLLKTHGNSFFNSSTN